ncbi:MAG: protein kinase [Planctomycetaceae bacterium]
MSPYDCPKDKELTAYFTGQLLQKKALDVEQHIESCPECAQTYHQMGAETDPLLAAICRPIKPADAAVLKEAGFQAAVGSAATLGTSAASLVSPTPGTELPDEFIGQRLGQYELLELIGRGGMGRVYRARHLKLDRIAAVKVLPRNGLLTKELIQRFEREMRAVGRLQHPNIVQAFDADEVEGTHFLAMEYVDGVNLSALLKGNGPLAVADACEMIRQAADALQHAYENGLVHRDIKPANLMLASDGKVRLLDLGLALLQDKSVLESSDLTSTGQLMGTIDYMAPEQAEDTHAVDIRADIYSLGASLYALLAGHPPFGGGLHKSMLKKIAALATETVTPIREHRPDVPEKLAECLHQMLSRVEDERPVPPSEVAVRLAPFCEGAQLQRLLGNGEPGARQAATQTEDAAEKQAEPLKAAVSASPDISPSRVVASEVASGGQGGRSFRTLLATGFGVIGVLLALLLIRWETPAGTIVLELNQDDVEGASVFINDEQVATISTGVGEEPITVAADAERYLLKVTKGGFKTYTKEFTLDGDQRPRLRVFLEPVTEATPAGERAASVTSIAAFDRSQIDPYELKVAGLGNAADAPVELVSVLGNSRFMQSGPLYGVACGGKGQAATVDHGEILVWDLESGEIERRIRFAEQRYAGQLDWSSHANLIAVLTDGSHLVIVDLKTEEIIRGGETEVPSADTVLFSPDGRLIVTGHTDGTILLHDVADAAATQTWRSSGAAVQDVAFSPDGSRLAVAHQWPDDAQSGSVSVYRVDNGEVLFEFSEHESCPKCVTFDTTGERVISGDSDGIQVWDSSSGEVLQTISLRHGTTECACHGDEIVFLNDGIRRWSLKTNEEIGRVSGTRSEFLAFDREGGDIVTVDSRAQRLNVIPINDVVGDVTQTVPRLAGTLTGMDVSPDGNRVAIAGMFSNDVEIWDMQSGTPSTLPNAVSSGCVWKLKFSGDGQRLGILGQYNFSVADVNTLSRVVERTQKIQDGRAIDFLQDAERLFTASLRGAPQIWDAQSLAEIESPESPIAGTLFAALSPSAEFVACCTEEKVIVCDVTTMKARWETTFQTHVAAWHPNSRNLAVTAKDVIVHDTSGDGESRVFGPMQYATTAVTWNPTGTLIAAASQIGELKLWDFESGKTVMSERMPGQVQQLEFSPDGRYLYVANINSTVYVLDIDNENMVPWNELPDAMKQFGYGIIQRLPYVLAKADYKLVEDQAE